MIFISYATENLTYATELFRKLYSKGFDVWFAPIAVKYGANFTKEIADALSNSSNDTFTEQFKKIDEDKLIDARMKECASCDALVFVCSRFSKNSAWCRREIKIAIKKGIPIFVLKIDESIDSAEWELMFVDVQTENAPKLTADIFNKLITLLPNTTRPTSGGNFIQQKTITYRDIQMETIATGDPYFEEEETLFCRLSKYSFYLSPPSDMVTDENREWRNAHFALEDEIFGSDLYSFQNETAISDLVSRIEKSKRIVFEQFIKNANGCYFNNKKYGINKINPYGRTEDYSERPVLDIELYTTDYYTHRVMKEVCKGLYQEHHSLFFEKVNFGVIDKYKILLTSFGINLLLLDGDNRLQQKTLLTVRSVNCAETYGLERISLSVIEGVSLSDYDHFKRKVNLRDAVRRGLEEELGVTSEMLDNESIHFYDMFINLQNLEIGISCTSTLKNNLSIYDIAKLESKDKSLEVCSSKIIKVSDLYDYVLQNQSQILPQAIYSIGSYVNRYGNTLLLSSNIEGEYKEESFILGKTGNSQACEDIIVNDKYFKAVIDGATSKSAFLHNGKTGGRLAAELIAETIQSFDERETAISALRKLDLAVANICQTIGSKTDNSIQASVIIYSKYRREIWNYGDCNLMINEKNIYHNKIVDNILSHLRSFVIAAHLKQGGKVDDISDHDIGREAILPYLKMQNVFANSDGYFGYPVINGMGINEKHILVYKVVEGDHIVLASDGYPKLFSSLQKTEEYLQSILQTDPLSYLENIQTKMCYKYNLSYDDRTYYSFFVN